MRIKNRGFFAVIFCSGHTWGVFLSLVFKVSFLINKETQFRGAGGRKRRDENEEVLSTVPEGKKKSINDNWNSPPRGQWIIRNSLWKTRLCNLDQCVSLAGGIFRKAAVWAHRCGSWLHTPVRLGGFATKLKKKRKLNLLLLLSSAKKQKTTAVLAVNRYQQSTSCYIIEDNVFEAYGLKVL